MLFKQYKKNKLPICIVLKRAFFSHYLLKSNSNYSKMLLIFFLLDNLTLDHLFFVNFYISYQSFCLFFQLLDLLPEILLLFFILFSLVGLFNDKTQSELQYYRWFLCLVCLVLVLLLMPNSFSNEATLAFGFVLINC